MTNIDPAIVEAVALACHRVNCFHPDTHISKHFIPDEEDFADAQAFLPLIADAVKKAWDEGYATCLGDFDIAARRESRSPNPHGSTP